MIAHFSEWLAGTELSLLFSTVSWFVPLVQTIHILAIAAVIASMAMLNLRVVGIAGRDHGVGQMADRFLPWMWRALLVLIATGAMLIVAEPPRSLLNPLFQAKMGLLLAVVLLTLGFQAMLKGQAGRWDREAGAPASAKLVALVSLLLWVAIIFAGRWIAYVDTGL
ncbi:MAG TPA: DUF6644 family protein [Allosphingosinicella sp.]